MKKASSYIAYVPLVLAGIVFLFPFFWMLTGSFKPQSEIMAMPPSMLPIPPVLTHYESFFSDLIALRWLLNSFVIAGSTTVLLVLFSAMSGYAFAKKQFRGRDIIFGVLLIAMMIPRQVLLVPMFSLMGTLNMFDTYQGVVLPALGWPFGVFMMRQFAKTLPSELLEAARVDGSGELRTFFQIIFPMLKPAIGALSIFTFIDAWNDYMWQLLTLKSKSMYTLSLGLASMKMRFDTSYGQLMAGAVVAAVPMIICFVAFQRYFTSGITMGAVKG